MGLQMLVQSLHVRQEGDRFQNQSVTRLGDLKDRFWPLSDVAAEPGPRSKRTSPHQHLRSRKAAPGSGNGLACMQNEPRQPRTNKVTSGSSPTCRLQWPCTAGSKVAPAGRVSAE